MGDTCYHFRLREQGKYAPSGEKIISRRPAPLSHQLRIFNRDAPAYTQISSGYLYGFVFFRQVRDKSIRRGYFQKSVVILSRLPFVALFRLVVARLAPQFFDQGPASLEAACHDIDQWPPPRPGGQPLVLPLLGCVLRLRLPARTDMLLSVQLDMCHTSSLSTEVWLVSAHEVNLFHAFFPVLPHLQLLWELVLLAEPILVLAASPDIAAELVQALVSCIQPLCFATDYRPYFTIHDCEFKEYTSKTQAP